jgi:hypothetical protein
VQGKPSPGQKTPASPSRTPPAVSTAADSNIPGINDACFSHPSWLPSLCIPPHYPPDRFPLVAVVDRGDLHSMHHHRGLPTVYLSRLAHCSKPAAILLQLRFCFFCVRRDNHVSAWWPPRRQPLPLDSLAFRLINFTIQSWDDALGIATTSSRGGRAGTGPDRGRPSPRLQAGRPARSAAA